MNQGILNILNPMHALPDIERARMLQQIANEHPDQWNAAQFMLQEGQPELAVRYLKQLCNQDLHTAGALLEISLKEEEKKPAITVKSVVDYAKGRHDYNEAKPCIDMLNRLCRNNSSEEELAQIDSIETFYREKDNPRLKPTNNVDGDNEGVIVGGNLGISLSPNAEQKLVEGLIDQKIKRVESCQ